MQKNAEKWESKTEFPDELNPAQNQFSVDVLVYFPTLDEHTVGWFDFNKMKWQFLSNQQYGKRGFKWRYFDEGDQPPKKKKSDNPRGHFQGG